MKIWFDASPHSLFKNYHDTDCRPPDVDCTPPDTDCTTPMYIDCTLPDDNDCTVPIIQSSNLMWLSANNFDEMPLQRPATLIVQPCSDTQWLICNPISSGQIAVCEQDALTILSLFDTPLTLTQATQLCTNWSQETFVTAVLLFYRLGFLQQPNAQELINKATEMHTLTAWLHVTNDCNLFCDYCYINKTKEAMQADTGKEAIDALIRSALQHNMHTIKIKYAGGEASLYLKNVIRIHDYAVQRTQEQGLKLQATLLSNGLVLSQHTIEQLKMRHIAVTISLDGLGATHDSQRRLLNGKGSSPYVLQTIERLLTNDLIPFISVTISRRNLAGLPDLMRYILTHKLPFSLSYVRDNDCSAHITDLRFADEQIITAMRSVFAVIEEQLPTRSLRSSLLDKTNSTALHHYTCGVGQNYLVIDQYGGVSKCQMEIQQPVTTVKHNNPLQVIRADRQGVQGLPVQEKMGCRTCEWRYWCTGGCPIVTYRATGRYDVKSPNCNIYKTLFPEVLRLEALRLLRYITPVTLSATEEQALIASSL